MKIEASSSSSSSSCANSGDKGRVCICCWCDNSYYGIYVLDFDEDSNNSCECIEKSPDFRIDVNPHMKNLEACVSDPYAYVLGLVTGDDIYMMSESGEVWVSRYDLRRRFRFPRESSTVEIGPSELEEGRLTAMKYPKFYPSITASVDGSRVVVYSRYIKYFVYKWEMLENEDVVDFEVFNTESQDWSQFPPLSLWMAGELTYDSFYMKKRTGNSDDWIKVTGGDLYRTRHYARIGDIESYLDISDVKFITGNNTLLVTLDVGLNFTLNLDSLEEGWKYCGDEHIPYSHFTLSRPEPLVVVTPDRVKVVRSKDEEMLIHYLSLSSESSELMGTKTPIFGSNSVVSILKYVENKECVACIFTYAVEARTLHALLVCDLFKLDLVPRDGNDCRPIHLGTYKYLLYQSGFCFTVDGVVPFPTAIESQIQKRRKLAHGTDTAS